MPIEKLINNISQLLIETAIPWIVGQNLGMMASTLLNLQNISKFKDKILTDEYQILNFINSLPQKEIKIITDNYLKHLMEKLKNYVPAQDLKLAYNNILDVKVRKRVFLLILGLGAQYSAKDKKISYALKISLAHEFLHLASSFYDKNSKISYIGFSQTNKKATIGNGINEGYTALLTARIYSKKNKVITYNSELKLARLMELFFDDPKEMAHLYFNCNLPGLIRYFEKFAPKKEVVKLILDIDILNNFSRIVMNPISNIKTAQIYTTLYKWFLSKNCSSEKLKQFEDLIFENKMSSIMIKKQEMTLRKKIIE